MANRADTDLSLTAAARLALGEHPDISMGSIQVDAIDGTLRLMGTVNSLHEKIAADEIACRIPDVKHVENNLVISPSHSRSDEEIQEAVENALGNFPEGNPPDIGVRVVDSGKAYLTGKARSIQESQMAINMASKVPGVRTIINEINVVAGRPLGDTTIKNSVSDAISDNPKVDPFSIEIRVEDSNVFLEGEVEDEEAVEAAGELAANVTGVKHVINHLHPREE